MLCNFSHVQFFATPWTVAHQAPLSMGFSQQGYWEWVTISFSRKSSQSLAWVLSDGGWQKK